MVKGGNKVLFELGNQGKIFYRGAIVLRPNFQEKANHEEIQGKSIPKKEKHWSIDLDTESSSE